MRTDHTFFMQKALALAKKGLGYVSPNPSVGSVVVKAGRIIAGGYHKVYGGPHAEVDALSCLSNDELKGAMLYVTLEPCSHFGKTPPCAEYIVKRGIKKVIIGVEDRNPKVSGKGIGILKKAGVQIESGILSDELERFYRPFFKYVTEKKPFVTLKIAQSLDGKNSVRTGEKYLVSGPMLRKVHEMRFFSDAIMVGVNTVITDDPSLDIRLHHETKPLTKVILDSNGRTPADAKIFRTPGNVIIYTNSARTLQRLIRNGNCDVVRVKGKDGLLDLKAVMKDLGNRGIQNLLVEAGGTLSFSILKQRLADRLVVIVAPLVLGGAGFSSVGGAGFKSLQEAVRLNEFKIQKIGGDLMFSAEIL